jgi:hypothetical protein
VYSETSAGRVVWSAIRHSRWFWPPSDEEWSVAEGVGSMLAREYIGEVEVIASYDLSADRTGELLGHLDLLTRLPSQILGGRDAVIVCFTSRYRRLHLDLRHAQVCLHYNGPRGASSGGGHATP